MISQLGQRDSECEPLKAAQTGVMTVTGRQNRLYRDELRVTGNNSASGNSCVGRWALQWKHPESRQAFQYVSSVCFWTRQFSSFDFFKLFLFVRMPLTGFNFTVTHCNSQCVLWFSTGGQWFKMSSWGISILGFSYKWDLGNNLTLFL